MRSFLHWLMRFAAKFPPEKQKLSWIPPERLWLHPLWPTPHPPPCLLLPLTLLHQTHYPFSHHSHVQIPWTAVKPQKKKAGIRCQHSYVLALRSTGKSQQISNAKILRLDYLWSKLSLSNYSKIILTTQYKRWFFHYLGANLEVRSLTWGLGGDWDIRWNISKTVRCFKTLFFFLGTRLYVPIFLFFFLDTAATEGETGLGSTVNA